MSELKGENDVRHSKERYDVMVCVVHNIGIVTSPQCTPAGEPYVRFVHIMSENDAGHSKEFFSACPAAKMAASRTAMASGEAAARPFFTSHFHLFLCGFTTHSQPRHIRAFLFALHRTLCVHHLLLIACRLPTRRRSIEPIVRPARLRSLHQLELLCS